MPTIDDINAQKNAAVAILDQKILGAITLKNAGDPGMDPMIHDLMAQRVAVFLQAYIAALTSPEMTKALAALKAATADMNKAAAVMVTATTFVENAAGFLSGAKKVVAALKGGG